MYNVKIVLKNFWVYDICIFKICNYGLIYKYIVRKLIFEDIFILK